MAQNNSHPVDGSHAHAISKLAPGETHAISRIAVDTGGRVLAPLNKTKGGLSHLATSIYGRVIQRHPERRFSVSTGTAVTADNRLHAVAIIERTA